MKTASFQPDFLTIIPPTSVARHAEEACRRSILLQTIAAEHRDKILRRQSLLRMTRNKTSMITSGGFTLIELVVVMGIIALLISILLPVASHIRDQANRVHCANNLRQIALAMIAYSRTDPSESFPRTFYNPKGHLQLDSAGYLVPNAFGKSGYVGENNVPASIFLLMKTQNLDPMMFVCPSTQWQPDFNKQKEAQSSNWELIPRDMSYSMAAPFPSPMADKLGFRWRTPMRDDFALMADINPGTRGGTKPPNNVLGPTHTASAREMMAANSNNHANKGQNVVYGDCHVEFQDSPYSGAYRDLGLRDNIYTAGAGEGGICDDTALPVDEKDSVMLPTDDPGGK